MTHATALPLIQVILLKGIAMPLTYAVPEGMVLNKGDVVQVPIGRRQEVGIVWEMGAGSATDKKAGGKSFIIKAVLFKYDVPPLPEALQQFVRWVAAYSVSGYGAVLKMVLSVPKALTPAKQATVYRIGDTASVRMTAVRQHIVDTLRQSPGMTTLQIKTQTGASSVIIKNLIEQGVLIPHEAPIVSVPQAELLQPSPPLLSVHQQAAADALCHAIDAGGYSTTLLDGVTGSGKTEVYFAAIEEACKTPGAQVLVLLPEIILTAQWVKRFKERFGVEPVQWHSGLTPAKRVTAWRAIASGNARLVVGARSALFLPYHHLKLIIVDEEHDASFKQEEGVLYQGVIWRWCAGILRKFP